MSSEVNSEMFDDDYLHAPDDRLYMPYNVSLLHLSMWNNTLQNMTGGRNLSWMIYLQATHIH